MKQNLDTTNIKNAGKSLISIARLIVISIAINILFAFIFTTGDQDEKSIQSFLIFWGLLNLGITFGIIVEFNTAGNYLIASVNESENNEKTENPLNSNNTIINTNISNKSLDYIESNFKDLNEGLQLVKEFAKIENCKCVSDIIISFTKEHTIKNAWRIEYPILCQKILDNENAFKKIENTFDLYKDSKKKTENLLLYIKENLK